MAFRVVKQSQNFRPRAKGIWTYAIKVKLKQHLASFCVSQLTVDPGVAIETFSYEELGPFWSITKTAREISLVSLIQSHKFFEKTEGLWTVFEVDGILDLGLVGILSSLTKRMADAGISVFSISTFNPDYTLVKENMADGARSVWDSAGFRSLCSSSAALGRTV